jgi:very-short-patch-repair endonuclease
MSDWVILLLFLVIISLARALFKKKSGKGPVDFPYQLKEVLCSPAERSFLGALDQIVGKSYRIFVKVRLADIVDVQRGLSASARQSAFNRISRKHLDFVICDSRDLSIVGAVELDDKSHRKTGRQERDQFLDKALEAAGVPMLRVKAQSTYSIKEVSSDLNSAFNINVGGKPEEFPGSSEGMQESSEKQIADGIDDFIAETIAPVCQKCGGELIERVATKGQYAGQKFWGCSNFPKCKFPKKLEQEPGSKPESKHDP